MIIPIFFNGGGGLVFCLVALFIIHALENQNYGTAKCTSWLGHSYKLIDYEGACKDRICTRCGLIQRYGDDDFFGINEGWYDHGQAENVGDWIKNRREHMRSWRENQIKLRRERESKTRGNIIV